MAEALWTATELQEALQAECSGELNGAVNGISIDTRTLAAGDLFFAIRGDNSDGHAYADKAFAAGAPLAVVSRDFAGEARGALLRVGDTLEALNALGRAGRARSRAKIIAVTGSAGKTGTKEMLRLMLGRLGRVHASEKSYNNHWGVPLTAARLPRDADYAVFEIGMNHSGEITPLTRLVRPHAAIVTTVAPVHLEFFGTTAAIAEAKGEIFLGLEPGGAAILNRDNEHFEQLAALAQERAAAQIIGFGRAAGAQARLLALRPEAGGSVIDVELFGERLTYRLGAPGEHLAMNSLAALAAVKSIGGDVGQAAAALVAFAAPQGRGAQSVRVMPGGSFLLIDESYNANPASMAAALKVLGTLPDARARRRVAVLGDMLELGAESLSLHRGLVQAVEAGGIDTVFCCGPQMAALNEALKPEQRGLWEDCSANLKEALVASVRPGDAVMIKGSLGSRMGLLVDALKQQFPEETGENRTAAE